MCIHAYTVVCSHRVVRLFTNHGGNWTVSRKMWPEALQPSNILVLSQNCDIMSIFLFNNVGKWSRLLKEWSLNAVRCPTNHVSEIVLIFPCFYLFFPVIPFFDGFALDCPCFFLALLLFSCQFFNCAKYCCFLLAI